MHHVNSPNKELNELRRQFMVEQKIIEAEFKQFVKDHGYVEFITH